MYDFPTAKEEHTDELTVFVDTDFAGCTRTRRSTSGGVLMMGNHVLKHYSSTQPTVALSSGEAELVGIVKGATTGLGMQSLANDLGVKVSVHVRTDATAAIGICRRRGLGKVRHLDVADLWVQVRLKTRDFALSKIPGSQHPADALTKYVEKQTLITMLDIMNLKLDDGRPELAPKLTT